MKRLSVLQIGMGWISEMPGGLNRYYRDLLVHLPAAGVDPHGLVMGSSKVSADSGGLVHGVAPSTFPLLRRLALLRQSIQSEVHRVTPELCAIHFSLYGFPLGISSARALPRVMHFHGPWADEVAAEGGSAVKVALMRALEMNVYRGADRFIVLSNAFRDVLCRRYEVDEARVRVIPPGIDLERFNDSISREQARTRLGWPRDRKILVSVRRLMKRMGLADLIRAVANLVACHPELLVYIGGKGPQEAELRHAIEEFGLEKNVRLLGYVSESDLPLLYRAADASIVPSVSWEGFGLVAAESLACGTPTFVTPVGGLPEVVAGLSRDLILDGSGPEAIQRTLGAWCRGDLRGPPERACLDYARSNFSWKVSAGRISRVYEECLRSG